MEHDLQMRKDGKKPRTEIPDDFGLLQMARVMGNQVVLQRMMGKGHFKAKYREWLIQHKVLMELLKEVSLIEGFESLKRFEVLKKAQEKVSKADRDALRKEFKELFKNDFDFVVFWAGFFDNTYTGIDKEAPQEVPQEAPQEVPQEAPQEVPQEAPQEAPQEVRQAAKWANYPGFTMLQADWDMVPERETKLYKNGLCSLSYEWKRGSYVNPMHGISVPQKKVVNKFVSREAGNYSGKYIIGEEEYAISHISTGKKGKSSTTATGFGIIEGNAVFLRAFAEHVTDTTYKIIEVFGEEDKTWFVNNVVGY